MSLPRMNITIASKIAMPAHVILSAWIGLAWMLQGSVRTAVPALYALRHVWPIPATGLVLALTAVVVTIGALSDRRALAASALGAGAAMYLILTAFIVASFFIPGAGNPSFSAPAWTLYPAVCHLASLASLAFDETTDGRGNHREGA